MGQMRDDYNYQTETVRVECHHCLGEGQNDEGKTCNQCKGKGYAEVEVEDAE